MKLIRAYIRLWIATFTYKLLCLKEFLNSEYEDDYRWFRFWEVLRFSHSRRSWRHREDIVHNGEGPGGVQWNQSKNKYVRVVKPKVEDYE